MTFVEIPDSDLAQFACEKTVMIGKTPVVIKPPSLMMIPRIAPQISKLFDKLKENGVNVNNYTDHMDLILEVLIDESIGLYEILTRIKRSSLVKIQSPIIHMQLIEAVLYVNVVSQEGFSKNWTALAKTINKVKKIGFLKKVSETSLQH